MIEITSHPVGSYMSPVFDQIDSSLRPEELADSYFKES